MMPSVTKRSIGVHRENETQTKTKEPASKHFEKTSGAAFRLKQ